MRAAITTKYGPPEVIKIKEVEKPIPKSNEVLVKVHATTVTSGDSRIRGARFPKGFAIPAKLMLGIFAPRKKILGWEFSGVVEQVGESVKAFKVGDEVIGFGAFGAHAEYVCLDENLALVIKPKQVSFEAAAAIPFGGTTALFFLSKANIKEGETILVNGASGAVGTMAIQIAKSMGAKVTGVCSSSNIDLVKSLGADSVIDYTQGNVFQGDYKYDVIFDTVGNLDFDETEKYLNPNGRFLAAVAGLGVFLSGGEKSEGKKLISGTPPEKKEDLVALMKLIENGEIKPVIGKVFDFNDIVQAHSYVDSGHKVGSASVRVLS